jgi:ATP-dependent DNA ligase
MLLLRTDSLPNDGDRWEYQLKFDGYRAIAFKSGGKLHLRSVTTMISAFDMPTS